jgi:predicted alpha/beta-hydrolase family hydrolase
MSEREEIRFVATPSAGEVGAILLRPAAARSMLVLAHGAGAGMRHPFLEKLAETLAERDVATFRWQFPYAERGSRRPDQRPVLLASVRAAIVRGAEAAGDLPLFAGGKSMGGRMTSLAQAAEALAGVSGLVFVGFPLHAAGKPSAERGEHLSDVRIPMLFLQGTRDALADLTLLRPVCDRLRARATLHVVDGADHSFRVRKGEGPSGGDVIAQLAASIAEWTRAHSA